MFVLDLVEIADCNLFWVSLICYGDQPICHDPIDIDSISNDTGQETRVLLRGIRLHCC